MDTHEEEKRKEGKTGEMQGVVLSIEVLLKDIAEENNEPIPEELLDYVRSVTEINVLKDFLVKLRRLESLSDMKNFF